MNNVIIVQVVHGIKWYFIKYRYFYKITLIIEILMHRIYCSKPIQI